MNESTATQLIRDFEGLGLGGATPAPVAVFLNDTGDAVYSADWFAPDMILGEIVGRVCDIHDISHDSFLFINDELVLDYSAQLCLNGYYDILCHIRENAASPAQANAALYERAGRYFLRTTRAIFPGEEIVYDIYAFDIAE